jgi:predicted aldo/keto reductase-like oxidoreductase
MNPSSRRLFLTAGLALPAAGLSTSSSQSSQPSQPADASREPRTRLAYRTLGKTGLKPTAVAFGCMITSDPSVIEAAADQGINLFDTARGYQGGNNERMVGAALKSKRKNLILTSKTGAPTKEGALEHLETSLRELGTDYLDVWYLHAKSRPDQITDGLMEAQRIAKQQGKVRFAGISTHAGHKELIPAVIAAKHFDVLLTSYNFSMEPWIEDLLADVKKAGIGIVGMKVMAGGFRRIKPEDPLYPKFKREGAHLAMLKWVLRNKNIDTTIPSITDLDQLDQNLRAMSESFSQGDQQLLATRLEQIRPLYCRMCGACEGQCPKGVQVSELVRFVSYADGYGEFALGREQYMALPEEERICGDCSGCQVHCPNGVQVASRVARAQELFA